VGVIETFFLLYLIRDVFHIGLAQIQTIIFLKLVVAGHLTLFVARTKESFFRRPFPAPILLTAIIATQAIAALIAGLGIFVTAIPWAYIGYIWLYCIVWIFIEDWAKKAVYDSAIFTGKRYLHYMWIARKTLHSHAR
jgi:H+-transporting ATPase